MKKLVFCIIVLIIMPFNVNAKRGCCSHHGGVAGCNENGRQICNDGTLSPSCTCTPKITYVYGCTDSKAKNYNSRANKNDGSCEYYLYGCTDKEAKNYNSNAEKDDGTCKYYKYGCMDEKAKNYNVEAEKDDGSCEYYKYGCVDKSAKNYDAKAEKDNGTCQYESLKDESVDEESDGIFSVLTVGGIGAGLYYLKKKKSNK